MAQSIHQFMSAYYSRPPGRYTEYTNTALSNHDQDRDGPFEFPGICRHSSQSEGVILKQVIGWRRGRCLQSCCLSVRLTFQPRVSHHPIPYLTSECPVVACPLLATLFLYLAVLLILSHPLSINLRTTLATLLLDKPSPGSAAPPDQASAVDCWYIALISLTEFATVPVLSPVLPHGRTDAWFPVLLYHLGNRPASSCFLNFVLKSVMFS